MSYSIQRAVSNGTLDYLDISIEYFDREEISVLFDGVVDARQWEWVGVEDRTVSFTPAVADGVEVTIRRTTDISKPRHEYSGGAMFTTEAIDESLRQVLYIAQEAREGSGLGEVYQDLNCHGFRVVNVGDASSPGDAVNLGQLTTLLSDLPEEIIGYRDSAAESAEAAAQSALDAINLPVAAPTHNANVKGAPADADEFPIADSSASWILKKVTWASCKEALRVAIGGMIQASEQKPSVVDSDRFAISDSAASASTKSLAWSTVKAALKSYFDTIYATAGTYVTSVGGNTGSVTNAQVASATLAGLGYTPAKGDIGVGGVGNFPVGTIVELELPASGGGGGLSAGATVSGSNTRFVYKTNDFIDSVTPPGTWRNLGPALSYVSSPWCASSVFQRIL